MICPKCGYERQTRDDAFVPPTECPSCGIVYVKHEKDIEPTLTVHGTGTRPKLRPSPVDPDSLKKARDRVEKRLRDRLETAEKDDRHTQTLELAKKITDTEIRKRQVKPTKPVENEEIKETFEDPEANPDNNDTQGEALLLEDMFGVQIHSYQQEPAQDNKKTTPEKDTSDQQITGNTDLETPSDGESKLVDTPDETETSIDEPSTAEDDFQVQTILLASEDQDKVETIKDGLSDIETATVAAPVKEGLDSTPLNVPAEPSPKDFAPGLMRLFPFVAWLILLAGVIGAILSWTTISDVEAGVNIPVPESSNAIPLGLLLGFAYLATGALGFAFFWVSSHINRQLKDIQQILLSSKRSIPAEETNGSEQSSGEEES